MNRLLLSGLWLLLTIVSLPSVLAQEHDWPRTVPLEKGMVTIYSPQVDKMTDGIIHFRAALAYRATVNSEPVFGVGWFDSQVEIDSSRRIVHPKDLKITEMRFPTGTDDMQQELSAALEHQSPDWNLDFSLDELEAALKTAESESQAAKYLNTTPPRIFYRDHPALLLSIDGDPVLREIENSSFEAVINTPYPLIFDGKHYYLNAARNVWYRAGKAIGPYQFEDHPPADIVAMVNANEANGTDEADEQPDEVVTAANAPEIVASTEPAELIVTEGPAAFVPLVDDLLVLQNSDDDVFMHVSTQQFYIVLAGRWYHASSLSGPWSYQKADDLPVAFARIPRDSDQADSRVYVAGTEEAHEAVLDAQVPQTAAVARGEVDLEVKYDGEPVYQPVDGTDLVYIQNTGSTVIQADGLYYLVENGVWYVSSSPNGPWQVSDHRPEQVDTILPTSPVYNVKYVRVYDSTPSVVYVGYTPGYTGSYVYSNTIFYGSGWNYAPWVSPYYYYPRHSTWGFNVSYNSWSGWNYGLSWGWGPFSMSYYSGGYWHRTHHWHHRHYGRWGPGGYHPRPIHHDRYGYRRNRQGHSRYAENRYGRGGRDQYGGQGSGNDERNRNLYRDGSQRARIAETLDKQPRIPDGRSGKNRRAYEVPARGDRGKNYAGRSKVDRYRTGPVNPDVLRTKADVRDVNSAASRSRLLADNSGNVYQPKGGRRDWSDAISPGNRSPKGKKSRTMPTNPVRGQYARQDAAISHAGPSAKDRKSRTMPTQPTSNLNVRKGDGRSSGQPSRRVMARYEQPSPVTDSSRSSRARITNIQVPQKSSRVAKTAVQPSQPRPKDHNSGQGSSAAVTVSARKEQPRKNGNGKKQRQRQSRERSS